MFRFLTDCLLQGTPAEAESFKKPRTGSPRRSERLSHKDDLKKTPVSQRQQLPSPLTCEQEESGELLKEATATPPEGRQTIPHRQADSQIQSSPLQETQAFSQQIDPNKPLSDEVEDEVKEGVWGYLIPYDPKYGGPCVVLRKRAACPMSDTVSEAVSTKKKGRKLSTPLEDEESFNESRIRGVPSGGYLIGRHPECGKLVPSRVVSWTRMAT